MKFIWILLVGVTILLSCKGKGDEEPNPYPGYCTEEPGDVWPCRRYFDVTMSPDGRLVAFIYSGDPHNPDPRTDTVGIFIFDSENNTFNGLLTGYGLSLPMPYKPDISPDGEWMVFSWGKQIWKVKVNGDSLTQLTFSGENFYPRWSPDGKKIVFHVPLGDSAGVWMINSDGSDQHRVR